LIVWQKGMALAAAIHQIIRRLPTSERYELASQMWRAAYSIPSNIAEGYARQTRPDSLKHLRIARGSLAELSTQFELALTLNLIPVDPPTQSLIAEEDRILQGLVMSLERKTREEKLQKSQRRRA
jgi:four helix bundle protein